MSLEEIKYYKMFVVDEVKPVNKEYLKDILQYGFILTGQVSPKQLLDINEYIRTQGLCSSELTKTLFSRREWKETSHTYKILKQIFHYVSFGTYGVQRVEIENDKQISFNVIKVTTKEDLKKAIEEDIYSDKPLSVDKISAIIAINKKFQFVFDFNSTKNREFKALTIAFSNKVYKNVTGDDILRAIIAKVNYCYGNINALLINSKEVRENLKDYVEAKEEDLNFILTSYNDKLAEVFHRHKDLFMSMKCKANAKLINRIAKKAKKLHKPVYPNFAQSFIGIYKNKTYTKQTLAEDVKKLTVTEKFKILNVLATKKLENVDRTFLIRNGKVWTKNDITSEKEVYKETFKIIEDAIRKCLKEDLKFLRGKVIKYPEFVDYALPISEKQSVGNVPFGTVIKRQDENKILTTGMYWRNEWGSKDLDLSSVDFKGHRVGWGYYDTYHKHIIFSGDITDATHGAIECIGNPTDAPVILVNNIFNGTAGTKFKIVIGEYTENEIDEDSMFIEDVLFNFDYKFQGDKKSCVLGALYNDKFIIYPANLGGGRISGTKDNAMLSYIVAPRLLLSQLLTDVGAELVVEGDCDIDLSLEKITFQDLVKLFERPEEVEKSRPKCQWKDSYLDEGDKCWLCMPDSIHECCGEKNCPNYWGGK